MGDKSSKSAVWKELTGKLRIELFFSKEHHEECTVNEFIVKYVNDQTMSLSFPINI